MERAGRNLRFGVSGSAVEGRMEEDGKGSPSGWGAWMVGADFAAHAVLGQGCRGCEGEGEEKNGEQNDCSTKRRHDGRRSRARQGALIEEGEHRLGSNIYETRMAAREMGKSARC